MSQLKKVLETWVSGESEPPIGAHLGFRLVAFAPEGTATVEMEVRPEYANPMGTVQGGVLSAMADGALGAALAATLDDGQSFGTMDLHLRYFRPVTKGKLVARAQVVNRGRKTAYLECDITDDEGRLVARAGSSCMII